MIKVSILVPIFNVEAYIQRCAICLFEQTYPIFEFIFIDDASPDNSIAILKNTIKEYPELEKKIKIITHDKNYGLATTRNTAISNAKGDFVFFVDSDDYIEKQTIEWMVNKQKETNADVIIGDFFLHTQDGIQEKRYPRSNKKEEQLLSILNTDIFHSVWNKLMRRSLFVDNNIRAKEGNNFGEDQLIMCQVIYFARLVCYLDNYTYHYNCMNPTSAWGGANRQFTEKIAIQLMTASSLVKSFFQDKEPVYYQKAASSEFHFFFLCLSELCDNNQKNAYTKIYKSFYPADISSWPLKNRQKPLYRLAFSNYYFMSIFLWLKKIKSTFVNESH